jgi:HK97 gp10 family phage protein
MRFKGFDDLANDLVGMASVLDDGPAIDRALEAGAAPMERQMLHNASTDPAIITGDLHDSIHTGRVRGGKRGKHITIGVHHSERGAYYANSVESGHGGPAPAPPHPFIRPAYDTTVDEAYDLIRESLKDSLNRTT